MGRPSQVDSKILERMLSEEGKTPKECADFFNVSISAISKHKKKLSVKSVVDHAHKVNEPLKKEMIEQIIKKHTSLAEQAGDVLCEATELEEKIREGLIRLDSEISKATTAIQVHEGNIIGQYCDWLTFDKPESKEKVSMWECEIESYKHLQNREASVRGELERQLVECGDRIKSAETTKKRLAKLLSYQDKKNHLRNNYSDKVFFELYRLSLEIEAFESEIFIADFIPAFNELKTRYRSKSIVLASVPKAGDKEEIEKFKKYLDYFFLRHDLLSRPWSRDVQRGQNLVREMRVLAHDISEIKDFGDTFLPQLQAQNKGYRILELR